MNFIKEDGKIYLNDDSGNIIAEINFVEVSKGVFNIKHTFVDESLRGQGIASKLVEEAVKEIKNKNGKVIASCSYASRWLEKHK